MEPPSALEQQPDLAGIASSNVNPGIIPTLNNAGAGKAQAKPIGCHTESSCRALATLGALFGSQLKDRQGDIRLCCTCTSQELELLVQTVDLWVLANIRQSAEGKKGGQDTVLADNGPRGAAPELL